MDDLTLGGPAANVAEAVDQVRELGISIGLTLNSSKCELIGAPEARNILSFQNFAFTDIESATLLGAPLLQGKAMDDVLGSKCEGLERAMFRLKLLASQDALLILRTAVASPVILNILRSSPCTDHPALNRFDDILRKGLEAITNCHLTESAWVQAGLPIASGGLGIRRVVLLAPSAFLASAAATANLQSAILGDLDSGVDRNVVNNVARWMEMFDATPPIGDRAYSQRSWDAASVAESVGALGESLSSPMACSIRGPRRRVAQSAPNCVVWFAPGR